MQPNSCRVFPPKDTHGQIASFAKDNDTPDSPNKAKLTTAQTATLETEKEFLRLDDGQTIQFRFSCFWEAASRNTTQHNTTQNSQLQARAPQRQTLKRRPTTRTGKHRRCSVSQRIRPAGRSFAQGQSREWHSLFATKVQV